MDEKKYRIELNCDDISYLLGIMGDRGDKKGLFKKLDNAQEIKEMSKEANEEKALNKILICVKKEKLKILASEDGGGFGSAGGYIEQGKLIALTDLENYIIGKLEDD